MKRSAQDAHLGRLIKLAHENPETRDELIPVIQQMTGSVDPKTAAAIKQAFSDESAMFVAWCIIKDDKLSDADCQRFCEKVGLPYVVWAPKDKDTPNLKNVPLAKGERVRCDARKNTNQKNTDECTQFNDMYGYVVDVDPDAVVVKFENGKMGRFDGKMSGKDTGLYREREVSEEMQSRAMLEVVYYKDKNAKPDKKRMDVVQEYVEKGLAQGESRSDIYYTGLGTKHGLNQQGTYYFGIFSGQRMPKWVNFSPTKGQVLYMGLLGHRPGGWKNDFAVMMQKFQDREKED